MQIIPSAVYRVGDRPNIMTSPRRPLLSKSRAQQKEVGFSQPACL
jgi:hypothetical protein